MTHTKGKWTGWVNSEELFELESQNAELLEALKEVAKLLKHQLGGSGEKAHKLAIQAIKKVEG